MPLRDALRQHRLDRHLTFDALSQDIARTLGPERSLALTTVRHFLLPDSRPHELTIDTITRYLRAHGVTA